MIRSLGSILELTPNTHPRAKPFLKKLVQLSSGCIFVMTRPKGRTYRIYAQGYKCLPLLIGLRKHAPPTHRPITQIDHTHVKHSPTASRDEPNIMRTARATQVNITWSLLRSPPMCSPTSKGLSHHDLRPVVTNPNHQRKPPCQSKD